MLAMNNVIRDFEGFFRSQMYCIYLDLRPTEPIKLSIHPEHLRLCKSVCVHLAYSVEQIITHRVLCPDPQDVLDSGQSHTLVDSSHT